MVENGFQDVASGSASDWLIFKCGDLIGLEYDLASIDVRTFPSQIELRTAFKFIANFAFYKQLVIFGLILGVRKLMIVVSVGEHHRLILYVSPTSVLFKGFRSQILDFSDFKKSLHFLKF